MAHPIPVRSGDTPKVIGLYGLPGSGKTYLLNHLKEELSHERFKFYEGAQVIEFLVHGGLDAFEDMNDTEKGFWRRRAIQNIRLECAECGKVGIVAGHFMFWPDGLPHGNTIHTPDDLFTFTHIIYFDVPPSLIAQRRSDDKARFRPKTSVEHLRKWQETEKKTLRQLCRQHDILFGVLRPGPELLSQAVALLRDFYAHSETVNSARAMQKLDYVVGKSLSRVKTVLVVDADRTLAPEDTGALFWEVLGESDFRPPDLNDSPLKDLFSSPLEYSYSAFRQAMLLYEEVVNDQDFNVTCYDVADLVDMYDQMISLLQKAAEQQHIGVIVVTCGLRKLWGCVLEKENLRKAAELIGGGRLRNGFVVTPQVKEDIVKRLKDFHNKRVWALGDSPLDLAMMQVADHAVVVVGDEAARSRTMDAPLFRALKQGRLHARQALVTSTASPRLSLSILPVTRLTWLADEDFDPSILGSQSQKPAPIPSLIGNLRVFHADGKNTAKWLMTPMRDASVAGLGLRAVHRDVGWYLAVEFLADSLGLEEYEIPHVQGHPAEGFRLRNEACTSIVALMRGGEPMAAGVNRALPLAKFIHAQSPEDIKAQDICPDGPIILVDSVINSGKSIVQFVQHIRGLDATVQIVLMAGVVQEKALLDPRNVKVLCGDTNITLITLRFSGNKFKGRGGTDTGNRLFNTTDMI